MVNMDVSEQDHKTAVYVMLRAISQLNLESIGSDRLTLVMDLTACHANGCPLDFDGLLAAPAFDFNHDIVGITQHIDRKTGKLTHCFMPRYAAVFHIK